MYGIVVEGSRGVFFRVSHALFSIIWRFCMVSAYVWNKGKRDKWNSPRLIWGSACQTNWPVEGGRDRETSNPKEQSKRGSLTQDHHHKYKGRIQSSWGCHTTLLTWIPMDYDENEWIPSRSGIGSHIVSYSHPEFMDYEWIPNIFPCTIPYNGDIAIINHFWWFIQPIYDDYCRGMVYYCYTNISLT